MNDPVELQNLIKNIRRHILQLERARKKVEFRLHNADEAIASGHHRTAESDIKKAILHANEVRELSRYIKGRTEDIYEW